jgi:regulatory protein
MGASGTATVVAGGSSFLIALDFLEELGLPSSALDPGSEIDDAALELLTAAAEAREALKRGLALVARAEQSAFMLGAKLESRGFSSRAVRYAVARLEADRFLDDHRFASAYAASRLSRRGSKPEGPASLAAALRERGIDRSTAAEALAELLGPEARAAALASAAEKIIARCGGDSGDVRAEVRRRLRELGYKSEEISEFFDTE